MLVSTSVSALTPRTRGAPSKPTADRWVSSAWVARQQGAAGRSTVSPTRMARPRLAVPPANGPVDMGPSAVGNCGLRRTGLLFREAEQGAGETRVGDQAMNHLSLDRGADRSALGDAPGDGEDERDPLERRAGRHDHAAVQRGGDRSAVFADEYPGHLGAHAEPGQGVALGGRDGVVDRRQAWRP